MKKKQVLLCYFEATNGYIICQHRFLETQNQNKAHNSIHSHSPTTFLATNHYHHQRRIKTTEGKMAIFSKT
jgi:hypothetical protein